jgi:hypothetical protein
VSATDKSPNVTDARSAGPDEVELLAYFAGCSGGRGLLEMLLVTVEIVDEVSAITPDWLTAVLRGAGLDAIVASVKSAQVGTGQMGSCYRLSSTTPSAKVQTG